MQRVNQMYFIHITNEHLSGKFLNCQIFTYMLAKKTEHLSINHFGARAEEQGRESKGEETERNTHRTMYNGQTHNEIIKMLARQTRAPNGHICVIY